LGKPVPRDLAFFLERTVFPGVSHSLVEEALSCSKLLYLGKGERTKLNGLLVVYAGAVAYAGAAYTRGDYVVVDGEVAAEEDSVLIYFPGECGRTLLAGLSETEACTVGDLIHRPPVCVDPGTSCIEAVRVMARHGVSSILVCRDARAVAIFTDTDLRRVVAEKGGVPGGASVEECGTPDPVGVDAGTTCADAARLMMEMYVKHLVVEEEGRVRGVVTVRDIAYAEALGPLYARRLLGSVSSAEQLAAAYPRVLRFLRRSLARLKPSASPGRVEHYARMASLALKSIVEKAAEIAAAETGVERGVAYLVAGSLGRQEQPLPTDRDSLVLYDPGIVGEDEARRFASHVEEILDRAGFPGCSHGYTARRLVYSTDAVESHVRRLLADPQSGVVEVGLLLDAVEAWPRGSGYGESLRRTVTEAIHATGSGPVIRGLIAAYRPRLGVLGRLPRRINLKRDLLAPIVYSAKALHVSAGLWKEVNTADRLLALAASGVLPGDTAEDALNAYRVGLSYSAWSLATRGTRELDTSGLSGYERQQLRAALQAAARLVDRARSPL